MIDPSVFKKKAIIPYFTYGDPSVEFTETLIKESFDAGADIIEIGFPFSDPIADGPVIQASHQRALDKYPDISLTDALAMVKRIKQTHTQPLVFMLSANLVFRFGVDHFFKLAASHGLDGVILPDLPVEESTDFQKAAKKHQIDIIFLVSPLCDEKRLRAIVKATSGFLYVISTTGTTGTRKNVSSSLQSFCKKIKKIRSIPLAVGFGISSHAHVKEVHRFSDGAIIGSYFTSMIESQLKKEAKAIKDITKAITVFKS